MMNPRDDAGAVAVEAAILAPALLLILALLMFGGRNAIATGAVEQAAVDAARAASLARTGAQADTAARAAASRSLADQDLDCATITIRVDTSGFRTRPGESASVDTTVTCLLRLSDLALPGIPGCLRISATAVSVVDTYRERR
jgi:Flp pilus assembly protein TadG